MATSRTSSALRLSRSAVAALRASRYRSQDLALSHRSSEILSSRNPTFLTRTNGACGFGAPTIPTDFSSSLVSTQNFSRFYSASAAASGQISNSEFTEMAWEGVIGAVDAARESKQQVVETEHLMKALLEQKDGLARRIFTKAGVDNSTLLEATNDFISLQPKVTGETSGPIVGSHLGSLLDKARKHKKEMGDSFVSVEHLLLAFPSDKRFGQQLFSNMNLSEKALKEAVQAVRGGQRVSDQNPEGKYEALEKYGNDLTELARRGKLDPVIGRDDEIRRCIQILSRRTKNNPVIIGEPGVGKTAIAEGYDLK
ncbi:chaperone 4, mitochondrial [Olea europaea subsp. europaea]|uniref:Chaperone 4, mitochondrial n=1 Tax=Olea europaea subsp. europaea TaxID=158383 RepID=A0A8S0SD67_OLEEU|nr:chaperone 4, mitochondrial [Olea europaea subsp. europaea]